MEYIYYKKIPTLFTFHYSLLVNMVVRDRETVSRWAHNPKIGGSTPSPATKKSLSRFDTKILIGSSLAGRASDSESGGPRFES